MAGNLPNVLCINDPNGININQNIPNGISEYQDMFIFAELTAARKGRTVLVQGGNGVTDVSSENTLFVNFLGNNQNKNSVNYLNFTTNYYDGSTKGKEIQYESFGISSIKVVINSSFIPQISIQFVDLRGLSFFNQENSPYRILFDFPPPVFNLKIKGYYGKTLSYDLHLVKYTSDFKAENGNFVIDADFIAITFAPLSDVLFRYIVNVPLIDDPYNMSVDPATPPKNTNDLIFKLKNLYTVIKQQENTSSDVQEYNNYSNDINSIQNSITLLSNFQEDLKVGGYIPYLFTYDTLSSPNIIESLGNIYGYDNVISSLGDNAIIPSQITKRLYIGRIIPYTSGSTPTSISSFSSIVNTNISENDTYYNNFISKLLTSTATIKDIQITSSDIVRVQPFNNNYNIARNVTDNNNPQRYSAIDITSFYVKLYRGKTDVHSKRNLIGDTINTTINNSIENILGMTPTIYNIFKIILDDVDKFFKKLRDTSQLAETHHNKYKDIIANGGLRDSGIKTNEKIYAFPLIIKEQSGCNSSEIRVSPTEINNRLPANDQFPESKLVKDFIDSFLKQKLLAADYTMKTNQNADGTNVWFPISPLDSQLSGFADIITPYFGIDSNDTNVNTSSSNVIDQIMKIAIDRFYILSEFSLSNHFYNDNEKNVANSYIDLYGKSEALNIILSVNSDNLINSLTTFCDTNRNLNNFYFNYLPNHLPNEYLLSNVTVLDKYYYHNKFFDQSSTNNSGVLVYTKNDIKEQTKSSDPNDPINKFMDSVETGFFKSIIFNKNAQESYSFTQQNTLFISDKKDGKTINNASIETRYFIDYPYGNNFKVISGSNYRNTSNKFLLNGNSYFNNYGYTSISHASNLEYSANVIDNWSLILSKDGDSIYNWVINPTSAIDFNFKLIILLSNFGHVVSPFNVYPFDAGKYIFQTPAVIEIPSYIVYYIGSLIDVNTNTALLNLLNNFFSSNGKDLYLQGLQIMADIRDVNTILNENDKKTFKGYYDQFISSGNYTSLSNSLNKLYLGSITQKDKLDYYKSNFNNDNNSCFTNILLPLLTKYELIVFGENTFKDIGNTYSNYYTSISQTIKDSNKKKYIDRYFSNFFQYLNTGLGDKKVKTSKDNSEQKTLDGDEDIVTQTYYSFKNINDKWLVNPLQIYDTTYGYPFNDKGKHLIDSFAFVDRAMNPIGNTVIDPEILFDLYNDTNVSVFSVLSQLLSMNGFEFFPLQNFMTYDRNGWNDSFKIDPVGDVNKLATFVCMYIGGSSSYPTNLSGEFKNDGIVDITTTDAKDFYTTGSDCVGSQEDDNQTRLNSNFPWKQVRAFRVKFGQQNQSMFTDIKIDSKEYPETNESLKILARLAGDEGKNSPIPKGQNLYNLYENRAYKATITGLGNAMIQPTQYFQLDNVPLYNGAYMILSVEHDIVPNKMTTSFSGTKILRYPMPRVLNPAASYGFEGSSDLTINQSTITTLSKNNNPSGIMKINSSSAFNPQNIQFNAPIDHTKVQNTQSFHVGGNNNHYGVDLGVFLNLANKNVEVWAAYDGIVTIQPFNDGGFGNYITIDHGIIGGHRIYTLYGHLFKTNYDLNTGDHVNAGDVLGWAGNTGRHYGVTGIHLHFEIRVDKNIEQGAIDPKPYLIKAMGPTFKWV